MAGLVEVEALFQAALGAAQEVGQYNGDDHNCGEDFNADVKASEDAAKLSEDAALKCLSSAFAARDKRIAELTVERDNNWKHREDMRRHRDRLEDELAALRRAETTGPAKCSHEWITANNSLVGNGAVCLKCGLFGEEDKLLAAGQFIKGVSGALTTAEQRAQGERCSCRGTNDLCPCQNVADEQTKADRAASAEEVDRG